VCRIERIDQIVANDPTRMVADHAALKNRRHVARIADLPGHRGILRGVCAGVASLLNRGSR
jgi:hypothetical protein